MLVFVLKRLLLAFLVAVTVSIISFGLLRITGDVAENLAGEEATEQQVEELRRELGLDRPLLVQYFDWASGALLGDLGISFFSREDVSRMISRRLPVTFKLGFSGLAIAVVLALPLGIVSAIKPNSFLDRTCISLAVFGQAVPTFFLGLVFIILFGVKLRLMPISGSDTWLHFVLPSITLATMSMPPIMRLTRNGMIETLESDYIRTAWAKGLSPFSVFFKHALRNAVIPVVSLSAVQLGHMLSGSVIIEAVFALDGVGLLAWESISRNDFPVVQSIVLMIAVFYIILTLIADMLNAFLDPRISGN